MMGSWVVYDDLTDVIRCIAISLRNRGTLSTEEQRHRGTVGTEEQQVQ